MASYEDRGEQNVKNVSSPVRVYAVRPKADQEPVVDTTASDLDKIPSQAGAGDKPSIAVLPFDNMSDSRDYEYLADGISEDIITLLSRIPGFLVIARTSTFSYKGKQLDIREIGRELGVKYVVEGSLRPVGKRLRATVQLIEAETGNHVWAERFDTTAEDLLDVQDEVTTAIVTRLEPELTRAEFDLIRRRKPADLDAWEFYMQAMGVLMTKGWSEETFQEGTELFRKAIALDPEFATARAALSLHLSLGYMIGYIENPDEAYSQADQALALDSENSLVLGFVGCAISDMGNKIQGIEILERALERDPSNAQAWVALGAAYLSSRQPERAIEKLEYGLRISPRDNRLAVWRGIYALALGFVGRIDDGIEEARNACRTNDKLHNSRVVLAALLVTADRHDEARSALAEARRIRPNLSPRETKGMVGGRYAKALEQIW